MKSDNGLYKLIYEYFETRLLYGYYACGDSLPSIARIGDMFHMVPGTVRSALALLEKKGYIRIDARKTARVIYEAPRVSFRKNAALYFVPRRNGITVLQAAGRTFSGGCVHACFILYNGSFQLKQPADSGSLLRNDSVYPFSLSGH